MSYTILLPLDGSTRAERALPYASVLAQASGARLLLLRAVPTGAIPIPHGSPDWAHVMHEVHDARIYLAGVAARQSARAVVETVVFPGGAAEAILEETRVRSIDLIVMCCQGHSGPERPFNGRVAGQVVRRAEVPVLLIPAVVERPWPGDRPLRIRAPVDAYDRDDHGVRCLDALAAVLGGELLPRRVGAPPEAGAPVSPPSAAIPLAPPRDPETSATGLWADRQAVGARIAAGGVVTTTAMLAREQAADMIVVVADRARSPSEPAMGGGLRMISGLMQWARLPLLVVRAEPAGG